MDEVNHVNHSLDNSQEIGLSQNSIQSLRKLPKSNHFDESRESQIRGIDAQNHIKNLEWNQS